MKTFTLALVRIVVCYKQMGRSDKNVEARRKYKPRKDKAKQLINVLSFLLVLFYFVFICNLF